MRHRYLDSHINNGYIADNVQFAGNHFFDNNRRPDPRVVVERAIRSGSHGQEQPGNLFQRTVLGHDEIVFGFGLPHQRRFVLIGIHRARTGNQRLHMNNR